MINFFTRTYFTILGLLLFVCVNAQTTFLPDGSIKFHGFVGHPEIARPGGKPTAIMVADLPADQVKRECTFYRGDSLIGFDFDKVSKEAALDGAKMYAEFRSFMFKKQTEFVKRKFNISALPFEIAAASKIIAPTPVVTTACNNLDFENGNLTGWTTSRGYNANSNNPLTVMASPALTGTNGDIYSCTDLNIISSAYGAGDVVTGITGPDKGSYSA